MQTKEQLQVQLRDMRQVIGQLELLVDTVPGRLGSADSATQRQLISTLVERVEVGSDDVRVVYRVGCCPFELSSFGGGGGGRQNY